MTTIGERLKNARLIHNMTQQQVADAIKKSKGNVSGYENGAFEPSASTIISLAECFNISTDDILIGTTEKS
ncbi:MAG: helix-turn-helix transcriptional regulator, partial [Hydrogenoanaerobacterium sp.]